MPLGSSAIVPVIMAGGKGTRLWPMSREAFRSSSCRSPARQPCSRTPSPASTGRHLDPPLVVCNDEHRFLVAEQLRQIGDGARRDPARARGAQHGAGRSPSPRSLRSAADDDPLLLVLPSDHVIADRAPLHGGRRQAPSPPAEEGELVTFGIMPDASRDRLRLHRAAAARSTAPGSRRRALRREAGPRATAEATCAAASYLWNSGMFVFRASTLPATSSSALAPSIRRRLRAPSTEASARPRLPPPRRRPPSPAPVESPSTTPSWRRPAAPRSSRSTPAGATSAPGPRSGSISAKDDDGNALRRRRRRVDSPRMLRPGRQPPGRRASACTTWSWSRPRTPCSSPTADRAQDVKALVEKLDARRAAASIRPPRRAPALGPSTTASISATATRSSASP